MSYVKFVSLEPHPVGPMLSSGPGAVPAVRTTLTPFEKPIAIGPSRLQGMGAGPDGLGGDASQDSTKGLIIGVAVVSIGALLIYAAYHSIKLRESILKKEGSRGLLAYEAGSAGIGLLAQAAAPRARPNRRSKRRRS